MKKKKYLIIFSKLSLHDPEIVPLADTTLYVFT